jgi:hypothetical protein
MMGNAVSLDLHGWVASCFPFAGGTGRRKGVAMAVLLVMMCWACTILYFFGLKILVLYDVLISLFTHFIPLGPIALIALIVALIVISAPKRAAD